MGETGTIDRPTVTETPTITETPTMSETRTETDSLGEIEVPATSYYGAQTERARQNFPISGLRFPRRLIGALGLLKGAAAAANAEAGRLDSKLAEPIRQAAGEVASGRLDEHFPLDIFQTGSGTSSNMNANEVIANQAIELLGGDMGSKSPVHPNDHVNMGQSSNDIIPTAIHVAAYGALVEELEPALEKLTGALAEKAEEVDDVVKNGLPSDVHVVSVRMDEPGYGATIYILLESNSFPETEEGDEPPILDSPVFQVYYDETLV